MTHSPTHEVMAERRSRLIIAMLMVLTQSVARQFIRDAMFARRSHWTNREAMTAPVVAGAVCLAEGVAAA